MRVLIVVAKAPAPGFAKTRLIGAGRSAQQAARLAQAFLLDTLRTCARVDGVERLTYFAPLDAEEYFRELAPTASRLAQIDGDLGQRMQFAFEHAFANGASQVALIGADTPHLPPTSIEAAFDALERSDVVLGPAEDGGYYLIALKQPRPELFGAIDWSTERVLAQTLRNAERAGLAIVRLPILFDIDAPSELERLSTLLASDRGRCPNTSKVLAELDRPAN